MRLGRLLFLVPLLLVLQAAAAPPPERVEPLVQALQQNGKPPLAFVQSVLDRRDLVVFDEGLHPAAEPWRFYLDLLRHPGIRKQVRRVFVEVLGTRHQGQLDAFFEADRMDLDRLVPALQDDFSGFGWRYENLLEFLKGLWELNHGVPAGERIRVVGVSPPVFWEAFRTRADYDAFEGTLRSFDHFMAATILEQLGGFRSGTKAFFLTNTRHAYTGLRDPAGRPIWNATTFLSQQHPGKVFSIRIHHLALKVEATRRAEGPRTAEGMEGVSYRWVRMADGAWDAAFQAEGNRPVGLPLQGNAFGQTAYLGNQMLSARPGSRMEEAYDGLVFLAPLERLTFCGQTDLICTPAFREEVKRRVRLLQGSHLARFLKAEGAATLDGFIDAWAKPQPAGPAPKPAED